MRGLDPCDLLAPIGCGDRAAIVPSTNIAPTLCGGWKMRKRNFKSSSIACGPQRTELSLISSCQSAATALAIQLLPQAESAVWPARRSLAMPIHRLLENHAFGPDEIRVLTSAFDDVLRKLDLADRADPVTEVVARKIIELAQQGERDPIRLSERAVRALSR
jgi:hypothetical protein